MRTQAAQPGGAPAYGASRSWTPLALTLGLHLLLALAWLGGAQRPAPEPPARSATLVMIRPPPRPAPAQAAPPSALRSKPDAHRRSVYIPSLPDPAPDASAPSAIAEAQADAAADPVPGELLASSKAMAGTADRQLRNGASPITAEPERKWERFADAFAAARTSAPSPVTLESHTSPDGVTIYRKTVAGRSSCYRSGSVGGVVTGFGNADGHGAGRTTCPSNVGWRRH